MPSGNVGIGTINPGEKLEVAGNVKITGSGNTDLIFVGSGTTYNRIVSDETLYTYIGGDFRQAFGTTTFYTNTLTIGYNGVATITTYDTDESLTIDPNGAGNIILQGNVGIGTTSPDSTLHVIGGLCVESSDTGCAAISGTIRASSFYDKDDTSFYLDPHATSVLKNLQVTQSAYLATSAGYNVGIGTTSPSAKLEIEGSGTGGLSLNASNVLFVNATTGNVGIGTTAPDNKLDVNGVLEVGTGPRGAILQSTYSDNFQLFTYTNTPNPNLWIGYGNGAGGQDTSREYISMNAGKIMLMNGNVGIGTTAPTDKLHIYNGYLRIDSPDLGWGTNQRIVSYGPLSFQPDTDNSGDPYIYFLNPAGSPTVFINTNSGNVGIGTTNPVTKLHVANADGGLNPPNQFVRLIRSGNNPDIYGQNLAYSYGWNLGLADKFYLAKYDGAYRDYLVVDSSGNVGIGTTSPYAKLDVAGNLKIGSSSTTCDANHRGEFRVELGASGVDDKLWMCMQNSTNSYNWVLVARGG
jgi:hypothetical protein